MCAVELGPDPFLATTVCVKRCALDLKLLDHQRIFARPASTIFGNTTETTLNDHRVIPSDVR